MKTIPVRGLLPCLLAMTIVLSGVPLRALASGTPSTEESVSMEVPPDPSLPEASSPGESAPEESVSEESAPEETGSPESEPEESVPEGSVPEETFPEESAPTESAPEEMLPVEPEPEDTQPSMICDPEKHAAPGLYFGLLGAHSGLSEGCGTAEDLFASAVGTSGLDFFAVTDHSDSFDHRESGEICTDAQAVSADWTAGKAAASAASSASFVGLFGYEMNWPSQMKIGHISTFGTPGFQSWTQEAYRSHDGALEHYYTALASVPGSVSQFNHPGKQYGSFNGFGPYCEAADRVISLLELDFGEEDPLRYYIQALDRGWHLAPTAGQSIYGPDWKDSGIRTAVHAQSLTETGILEALQNCRAYATEDPDLEILYTMDGHVMGSRLDLRHTGEQADLSVTWNDPTDGPACTVEVITNGGSVAAQQSLSGTSGTLSFSLPPASGYYFLRITQADGDRAVTAPIWVDGEEELGIDTISFDPAIPVRQEPVSLTINLYNGENVDFLVESLEILADGIPVARDPSLSRIPAESTLSRQLALSFDCAGLTEITVRLSGTLEGTFRSYEASLPLHFRQWEQATAIAADFGHGNAGLDDLNIFKALALEKDIRFRSEAHICTASLKDCRLMLVTAPAKPFSEEFLTAATAFAGWGGSIVLCGQDGNPFGNGELNRLLSAIGSTLRITETPVRDEINSNGRSGGIHTDRINRSLSWCNGISEHQIYRASSACAINPGQGQWVVTAQPNADTKEDVLLAWEELSGGGAAFAAGSLFLSDENLTGPKDIWDEPYANRTIAGNLLGISSRALPLSTIDQARKGAEGQLFRVRGYVTAGTSNPYNTFPDTLYLQDDTGGIAVTFFPGKSIPQGAPLEITGCAGTKDGNRVLTADSWQLLEGDLYHHPPMTGNWSTLLDIDQNGGRLVQVEGICREIYCREDNTLSAGLLEDESGNTAVIQIEDCIFNGSNGENHLHRTICKDRTVRAQGLLHTDEYGNTVVRVRNCAEVVWVPPGLYWNPRTGDFLLPGSCSAMVLSGLGLALLNKRKEH